MTSGCLQIGAGFEGVGEEEAVEVGNDNMLS
jgi:hypothetical protein